MRAFVAIPLAPAAREAVAGVGRIWRSSFQEGQVAWVAEANYHLTLRFLGEIDVERALEVGEELGQLASALAPFPLALTVAGAFPNLMRPAVLVLDAQGSSPLQELVADLDRRLLARGLSARDRPFRAHVTVGRVKRPTVTVPPRLESAILWTADRAVLYRSLTDPAGARYEALREAILTGEAES